MIVTQIKCSKFRKEQLKKNWLTEKADEIEKAAEQAVDAVKFAEESELPDEDSLYKDVLLKSEDWNIY